MVFVRRQSAAGPWMDAPLALSSSEIAITPSLAVGPGGGLAIVYAEEQDGIFRAVGRLGFQGTEHLGTPHVLSSEDGRDVWLPVVAVGTGKGAVSAVWLQGPLVDADVMQSTLN